MPLPKILTLIRILYYGLTTLTKTMLIQSEVSTAIFQNPKILRNSPFHNTVPDQNTISVLLSGQTATYATQERNKVRYLRALKLFVFESKRKNGSIASKGPKKEYLRTKLFRGHKRATRQSMSRGIPRKTLHAIDITSVPQKAAWAKFCKFNLDHEEVMIDASKITNGPLTDGRAWRDIRSDQTGTQRKIERTFNDKFCREYLRNEIVVESFLLYIDCLFADLDNDILCERFKFRCCRSTEHDTTCNQHWQLLRNQLKKEFIDVHRIP